MSCLLEKNKLYQKHVGSYAFISAEVSVFPSSSFEVENALGALAIGTFGLVLSCVYMENPYLADELFYGYPFLWLETSKSLRL
jgi:hypothetical protein